MVQIFRNLLLAAKKPKIASRQFIDSLRLNVKGGHGGNGVPKYGGVGGQGGCVYFVAENDATLRSIAKKIAASSGEDSSKARILGRRGVDQCIEVPVGVQVFNENGKLLGDMDEKGSTCLVAGGGMGGCSGTNFLGKAGEHRIVTLDLKLIADIGLLGFPNAGKSSLLKAISNANPRIASYPFTTVRPQIGIVEYPDLRSISLADLPGLIEGAHANYGMGHKFLKHVERTRLLLMVVDISGFRLSPAHKQRNCLENIYALNKELEMYDKTLLDKPCVLLINKMDLDGSKEKLEEIKSTIFNLETGLDKCPEEIRPERVINFEDIIPISAKNTVKVNIVKDSIRSVLDELAERNLENDGLQRELKFKIGERGPRIT